jgi:hypothetical protein
VDHTSVIGPSFSLGFAVDLTFRGNIRDYVEVYLGHTKWSDAAGTTLQFDGDQVARAIPAWLQCETVSGRNSPALHVAGPPVSAQPHPSDRVPSKLRGMRVRVGNGIAGR